MTTLDEIPGLQAAIAKEATEREAAFLPFPEFVCGLPVQPLTVRHVAILSQLELPFLSEDFDGELSIAHIEVFLWVLSPGFTTGRTWARRLRRFRHSLRFWRAVRARGHEGVATEVGEYVAAAFADSPGSGGGVRAIQYVSWIARLVDRFGSEYGWTVNQTLELPFKVAFQQERQIALRYDNNTILFNPSDKIRTAFLQGTNAGQTNN